MPIHPSKATVLDAELERLTDAALAGGGNPRVLVVDLELRRSPGPVSDDEWQEHMANHPSVRGRAVAAEARTNRRVRLTR